jgi:hypothetical protein
MPLEFLAAMVVAGLSLVIGAVHLSGLSRPAIVSGPDQARARFLLDFPDENPGEVVISADGRAAFIALAGGRTGLVHAMGDRFLTRILERRSIRAVQREPDGVLAVRLDDFTLPAERARFSSAADAAKVSNWLAGVQHA